MGESLPLSLGAWDLEGAGPQRSQAGWAPGSPCWGRAVPCRAWQTLSFGWCPCQRWQGSGLSGRRGCKLLPLSEPFPTPAVDPGLWRRLCPCRRLGGAWVLSLAQVHRLPRKALYLRGLLFCSLILVGAAGFYGNGMWGQLAGWSPGC